MRAYHGDEWTDHVQFIYSWPHDSYGIQLRRRPAFACYGERLHRAPGWRERTLEPMWYLDTPEHDPDENYPEPTAKQILYMEHARHNLRALKATLARLTIPQQRAIIADLSGGIFRREPLKIDPAVAAKARAA